MSATAWESVMDRSAQRGAVRSANRRYALAKAGHLRRSESSPSTLMTVGIPAPRVTRQSGELPAMKNSATSGRTDRAAWPADTKVCTNVSRYLLRTVGRWMSVAPFHSLSVGSTTRGAEQDETLRPPGDE